FSNGFTNHGSILLDNVNYSASNSGDPFTTLTVNSPGTLTNASDGTITIAGGHSNDDTPIGRTLTAQVNNQGLINSSVEVRANSSDVGLKWNSGASSTN